MYRPQFIDKLVVWGGEASMKHARKYLQPGLSIHPFDPKYSNSIIGKEAFADEITVREAAFRLACDIGGLNQEGCVNSRVVYVECGLSREGIGNINKLGDYVYEAMMALPAAFSCASKVDHTELQEHLGDLTDYGDGSFRVIGGMKNQGAIIVSQADTTVEFAQLLEGRTANLVPVDSLDAAISRLSHGSQTVGVYPDSLRVKIRDRAAIFGAQRTTSLGYATGFSVANRLDAVEPLREMCRWIIDEQCSPETVAPPWKVPLSTGDEIPKDVKSVQPADQAMAV